MKTNIVAVELESRMMPGEYGPRAYTYYTDVPLAEGDIIQVPTRFGAARGRVARANVPEHEVERKIRDVMRTITAPPVGHEAPKTRSGKVEGAGGPVQLCFTGTKGGGR